MDKVNKTFLSLVAGVLGLLFLNSCTELDQHVYSEVPEDDFWQTQEQIDAGVSPAYQTLTNIGSNEGGVFYLSEVTSDEVIIPTRGGDWYNGGVPQALWKHTWSPTTNMVDNAWEDLYEGIGRVNFALNSIDELEEKPDEIEATIAELKTLRAYFYFWALDLYGNVPIVSDFNTPPDSVSNSSSQEVFDFIETEITDNINQLTEAVDPSTYGRINKWTGLAILAKLNLNAEVYIGEERWQETVEITDSIINSGTYSLSPGYFDNFSPDNGPNSPENIFVVPFDKVNIGGNSNQMTTLHYQNQENFGLTAQPYNGFSSVAEFYSLYDTTSVYRTEGDKTYRTYNDQRSGQWLVGQQFSEPYAFPPDKDVLVKADESLKLEDESTGMDLSFTPEMNAISSSESDFRLTGVRNIKYFPEEGTGAGEQSNDFVLFRYADILLMKAESEARLGNKNSALDLVNQVRERAYSGDPSSNWSSSNLTLENILDERGRELAWELWRRQDLIRYEVASGNPYFSAARTPDKDEDTDSHLLIFPIPENQLSSNPNLKQNPGYD